MAAETGGVMGILQLLSTPLMALATHARLPEAWWAGGGAPVLDAWAVPLCLALLIVTGATLYAATRPRPVYLLDFACMKPGDAHRWTCETMMRQLRISGRFTEDSLAFQQRMLERSGLGDSTYVPRCFHRTPFDHCMAEAREEAAEAVFGAVDALLDETGVPAGEIGAVVVNCGMFNPAPSLSAMIVNRYGMGEGVRTYSLGGMGCSAGLIAVDLARQLLQVHPNTYALVVSTESMTLKSYPGNNRRMLLANVLFRVGGAAILLTNRPADRRRSKYVLVHTVRTHTGADDNSYRCASQEEDDVGTVGLALSKDLTAVAGEALKANITTLGPLVLPLSEQLRFFATLVSRKLLRRARKVVKPYIPDFKRAFEHFCIHAGGRAVLDEMERNLGLTQWHMEPSRMTLHRFGNTSSSCLWYELAYTECKGRVAAGDRIWQVGLGSGFKCNSAVWRALRTIRPSAKHNPWTDEIDRFPVPTVAMAAAAP